MRAKRIEGDRAGWAIHCPGCGQQHFLDEQHFQLSGTLERPTFSRAFSYHRNSPEAIDHDPRAPSISCHFFVKNGQAIFLTESSHDLWGQTVDLLEIEMTT